MAPAATTKTTYEVGNSIEPIYSGGAVSLSTVNGLVLATALGEEVVLTDLRSGRRLAKVEGDGEPVTALTLTQDGHWLIVCSRSLSMRICRVEHNSVSPIDITVHVERTLKPHSSPVVTVATDQTSTLLATGGSDGIVKCWDIRGGYTTHTLHGHIGVISALHLFEVSHISAIEDTKKTGSKRKRQVDLQENDDGGAVSAADGFRLASGSENGQIRVWNLHTRKCTAVLDSHVSVVRALDFSASTNQLLSGSRDKTVMIWDAPTWKLRQTFPILESVESAAFVSKDAAFYTAGESGCLRIWDLTEQREKTKKQDARPESQSIVQAIGIADDNFILTVHADQTLRLHDTAPILDGTQETAIGPLHVYRTISGTHDEVIDLAYVGRDKSMLAVAANLEEIRIVSLKTEASSAEEQAMPDYFGADVGVLTGHSDIIICLDVDWSGHWLATGAKDNTARLWRIDPEHGDYECWATFTGHAESLGAIGLPTGVPDAASAAFKNPLEHPPAFLITGSQDKTIKRWDINAASKAASSRAAYTRKAHDKDINAIDVDARGRLFASASQDRTVKIWSLEDGEAVGILRGHRRGVWTVKFAPADMPSIAGEQGGQVSSARGLVLTGSGDKTVKIWNLADFSCLRTFEGHTNSVLKVLWLPIPTRAGADGDSEANAKRNVSAGAVQVASAAGDGLVKLWDVNAGELAATLDNHIDRVWALAVNPATKQLVSGGGDSVITFWQDTTQATAASAAAESTVRVEQDQQLQNLMRSGSYREAITLALQLNHPGRLLALFTAVTGKYPPEEGSLSGVKDVDTVIATLGDEQLFLLLLRIRDWNTNARTAPVAQKVLWTVLKSYPPKRLMGLRSAGLPGFKGGNVKDVLDALKAYTERHYRRMEDLIDESYLVEYTLKQMDEMGLGGGLLENGVH